MGWSALFNIHSILYFIVPVPAVLICDVFPVFGVETFVAAKQSAAPADLPHPL